jgi:AcrB/AcrD/AcrF family protein
LPGSSASDLQAAQSAYDQANSQLLIAPAALLKQNFSPAQAAIAQTSNAPSKRCPASARYRWSVRQAPQSAQLEQPAGTLVSNSKDATVVLNGLVGDPRQLGDIVVSQTTSGPVFVRDVATIDDTPGTPSSIARVDGVPAITLTASKLPTASTITVSRKCSTPFHLTAPSDKPRTS